MRIAFVGQKGFPATWGGVEHHVDAVATRLAARGHEVTVYARRWYSPGPDDVVRGVRRVMLPTVRTKHLDASVHSALAAAHAGLGRADVVHFHCIGPALFAPIARGLGKPVVTTIHALDYGAPKWGALARAALRCGEQVALVASARVVVVSAHLEAHYRALGAGCKRIDNGVEVADTVEMPTGRQYLLALGRWAEGKGMAEVVEGFLRVSPPEIDLVVAGDAQDPNLAEVVRSAARGDSRVRFPGVVTGDAKADLLRGAAGFVTASVHEGLPLALLEALGAGLPCAASDIDAHREALAALPGETLFPLGDVDAGLRALIARMSADDSVARERRAAHVRERYSWDRAVEQLESVYRELIGGAR